MVLVPMRPVQKHMDHGAFRGRRAAVVILTPLVGLVLWAVVLYVLLIIF